MTHQFAGLLSLAIVTFVGCGPSTAEHHKVHEELISAVDQLTAALNAIDNAQEAKAALPKLNGYLDKMEAITKRAAKLPKVTKSQKDELESKYMPRVKKSMVAFQKAMQDAGAKPGVMKELVGFALRLQKVGTEMQRIGV